MGVELSWQWRSFDEFTLGQLYALLALRAEVFVVEQECIFQDVDGLDPKCHHLLGLQENTVLAYARVLPDGVWRAGAVSIGRIVSSPRIRHQGIGVEVVQRALAHLRAQRNRLPIELESQYRLERFYQRFGFESVGTPYIKDGQAHIVMTRAPDAY